MTHIQVLSSLSTCSLIPYDTLSNGPRRCIEYADKNQWHIAHRVWMLPLNTLSQLTALALTAIAGAVQTIVGGVFQLASLAKEDCFSVAQAHLSTASWIFSVGIPQMWVRAWQWNALNAAPAPVAPSFIHAT